MATHFKEQLAHFHTSHPSRAKASRESKMWSSILTHCLRAWFLLLKYKMSFFLIAWFLRGENRGQKDGNKRIRWEHVRGIQSLSDTALALIIFLSHNGAKPMMSSRSSGTFSIISGACVRHFFSQYINNHIHTHTLSLRLSHTHINTNNACPCMPPLDKLKLASGWKGQRGSQTYKTCLCWEQPATELQIKVRASNLLRQPLSLSLFAARQSFIPDT